MSAPLTLSFTDMHTAGEPVRIVTGGYPELHGATLLEKRRHARDAYDHLRRAMIWEPRGHAGMYGVIPVASSRPGCVMGVLFTHHEGYSTMCGHATIALGRWIVDQGLVPRIEPVTRFSIEAPCGVLQLACTVEHGVVTHVGFESVPAFAVARDLPVTLAGYGALATDLAYGGAFYAILPASRFGLDFFATPVDTLVTAAGTLTDHLRATYPFDHPDAPDLGFLYGTILTDDAPPDHESWNLCVFAERQIDRSPTGSGVTARMALDHAKGLVTQGVTRTFRGISGGPFTGRIKAPADFPREGAVTIAVGGQGYYAGKGEFTLEPQDPLATGLTLPKTFNEARVTSQTSSR